MPDVRQEFIDMANRAAGEISNLRAQVNQLMPMARAFEIIDTILRMGQQPQGYGEDYAATIMTRAQQFANELEQEKTQTAKDAEDIPF